MKRILDILAGSARRWSSRRPPSRSYLPSAIRRIFEAGGVPGLVLVLAYTMAMARNRRMFSRRQARYGSLSAFSIIVVLGIIVAINYIGSKQNKRWT